MLHVPTPPTTRIIVLLLAAATLLAGCDAPSPAPSPTSPPDATSETTPTIETAQPTPTQPATTTTASPTARTPTTPGEPAAVARVVAGPVPLYVWKDIDSITFAYLETDAEIPVAGASQPTTTSPIWLHTSGGGWLLYDPDLIQTNIPVKAIPRPVTVVETPHPAATRTGVAVVDSLIEAVVAGDDAWIVSQLVFTDVDGYGESFAATYDQAQFLDREAATAWAEERFRLRDTDSGAALLPYGVVDHGGSIRVLSGLPLSARYHVVFGKSNDGWALGIWLTDDGRIARVQHRGSPAFELYFSRQAIADHGYLLAPLAPLFLKADPASDSPITARNIGPRAPIRVNINDGPNRPVVTYVETGVSVPIAGAFVDIEAGEEQRWLTVEGVGYLRYDPTNVELSHPLSQIPSQTLLVTLLHPADTRIGIAAVDNLIEAITTRDASWLESHLKYDLVPGSDTPYFSADYLERHLIKRAEAADWIAAMFAGQFGLRSADDTRLLPCAVVQLSDLLASHNEATYYAIFGHPEGGSVAFFIDSDHNIPSINVGVGGRPASSKLFPAGMTPTYLLPPPLPANFHP